MESLMILVLVIAAVLAVFIKGAADERVKQRRQKRKIHEGFGAVPDRDYSDEELSRYPAIFPCIRSRNRWMISPGMILAWISFFSG